LRAMARNEFHWNAPTGRRHKRLSCICNRLPGSRSEPGTWSRSRYQCMRRTWKPWRIGKSRKLNHYRNFIDIAILALVVSFRSEVRLASARFPKNPKI
jgi:hypothetical protein